MILHIYTIIHTLISLIAIFTGFVVVFGLLGGKSVDGLVLFFTQHLAHDPFDFVR